MASFLLASIAAVAVLSHGAQASPELRVPKPTADVVARTADPQITTAPKPPRAIYARQTTSSAFLGTIWMAPDNVCGYVSGNPSRPWSCESTDRCAFATEEGGWAACCRGTACSISQVACIDRAGYLTSSLCGSACQEDIGTRKCTDTDLPYCGTLTFFSGIVDYQCVTNNASTYAQIETTYSGQETFANGATSYLLTTVVYEAQTTFTSNRPSTTSGSGSITTTSGQTTTTSAATTSTGAVGGGGGGSSTPIGAIVGGVVGGVALLALIAFGIWFMKSRQKKKASAAETQAMMSQNTGAGGPHGGPAMAPMQSPYSTGAGGQYPPPAPYNNGQHYTGPDPSTSPNPGMMAGGYYQDPSKQGFQQNVPQSVSPDPNRQSYQQGPVPAAWAQHTGGSGHQASQHTGSSTTAVHPQYPQHSGGAPPQQQQPTTYYEASGIPVGAQDPNPNHRGQFHELS